ncbi:MAG: Ig-like domain-containing protein, partial [Verrucomicrobiota bacterium]
SNNPITFAGLSTGTGWQGIRFVSANTNGMMSWCVVSGAAAGGIRFTNTSLALSNCVIVSNTGVSGGGIYTDSALWLQNCTIANNQAAYGQQNSPYFVQGGGLYSVNGGVTLQSCLVSNNTAIMPNIDAVIETSTGGGIDCEAGALTLNDCVIVGNQAAGAGLSATALGGGVYMNSASATISATGCVFQGNSATGGFGGGAAVGGAGLLTCAFSGNQATYGGAFYSGGSGQTMATNCLLARNAAALGGAVYSTAGQAAGDFENCTVAYNSPDACNGCTGVIHNSILFFNGTEIVPGPVNPCVNYSDVQGGYGGSNNLNVDPQFADTNDFLLGDTSPCIDAGDPAPQYNDGAFPPAQFYGTDRNDMGAYGGPGGAFWPAFASLVPVALVNGQPAGPYQVLMFTNTSPPTLSFSNGFSGGSYGYTLDGSNPAGEFNYSGPFVATNSAVVRAVAYTADESSYAISAPVFIIEPPVYPLAVSTPGGGVVSPLNGSFLSNSVATLTATASNGWQFLYWTNGVTGTNSTLAVTVNGPLTNVQAVFGTPLTAHVTPIGAGTVQTNPALALYPFGSTAQLIASPSANRYFTNWNIGGALSFVSPLDFIVTNATPSVTAVFGNPPASQYSLNLSVAGSGDVSRNPQAPLYTNGSVVAVTATPAAGWVFSGWTGNASGSANPLNVTLNGNLSIAAVFISAQAQPPSIAITNPVSGAQFAFGSGITVDVSVSDPNANGSIEQVVFFNGPTQLGVVTNSPFAFLWTNALVGTNILTAVASDNFGLATLSAPVSLTVTAPPPGPPVFTLSSGNYSVLENGGSVAVTVQKSLNSLGGVVNYSTANGSAVAVSLGVGNYQAASGSLSFAAGQSSQTVSI